MRRQIKDNKIQQWISIKDNRNTIASSSIEMSANLQVSIESIYNSNSSVDPGTSSNLSGTNALLASQDMTTMRRTEIKGMEATKSTNQSYYDMNKVEPEGLFDHNPLRKQSF